MPTVGEWYEEAKRLFPNDRERQRRFVESKVSADEEDVFVQEILGTKAPTVEEVKTKLAPTIENAQFVEKLEQIDGVSNIIKPSTVPVAKTTPSAAMPSDEDTEYLIKMTELFGKDPAPSRIEGYSDEQLEALIDMKAPNHEQAREELTARKSGSVTNKIKRLAGQQVAGAAEVPTSGPIALTGLLAKAGEFATGADLSSDAILETAEAVRKDVRASIGISEPRDISESVANIAGSLVPVPGIPAPTGLVGNLVEVATPLLIGSGNKRVVANFITAAAAEQGMRELADTGESDYKTVFDVAGITGGESDKSYPEAMQSIAIGLGIFTGASLLGSTAMHLIRNIPHKDPVATPIRVLSPNAPDDLKTLETATDVRKAMYVDSTQVLSDLAKRAGVVDFDALNKRIEQDTQMSAQMRVNEAQITGRLHTANGSWEVDVTPRQLLQEYKRLPQAIQDDADLFNKYNDVSDVLQNRIDTLTKKLDAEDITDDVFIQLSDELDEAKKGLISARKNAFTIQQRTPEVTAWSDRYKHIIAQNWQFLASGEDAMISPDALQKLQKTRPNFVPNSLIDVNPNLNVLQRIKSVTDPINKRNIDDWYRGVDTPELDVSIRANSFETLADYTRSALEAKIRNGVRHAYTKSMIDSEFGSETMRKASKKEIEKFPNRIVDVWEGGKKVKYISSQLQADLLQLDAYYTKHPTAFALKRIAEVFTTGALSPVFALKTFMRDSIAGHVLRERGAASPLGAELPLAIAKPLYARGQLAFADLLQNSMVNIPFLDTTARRELAAQVSNSYMNSFYHMFNQAGGVGASLTKESIQVRKGVLREAARTLESAVDATPGLGFAGRSAGLLAKGWSHLFNAISEAPRFAAAERNIKAGLDAVDAVSKARRITGDVTRSGRAYLSSGRRITGDVKRQELLATGAVEAPLIQFIREATPFYNPTVQGMRNLVNSFINDPLGTNLRAWKVVGLPSLAIYAWNEMLGEEYNRYNFERRSSSNIAMNYPGIGIPGRPPEESIEIPLAHEMMMFNSPWTTALYGLARGSDSEEINKMMTHMGLTILENGGMIGFPQIGVAAANIAGVNAPKSVMTPWNWADDVYQIREDNAGVAPANIEKLIRNTFGAIGEATLLGAAAFHDDGLEAALSEMSNSIVKRTPIVKDLTGNSSSVSAFTPISEAKYSKVKGLYEFLDAYEEHVSKAELLSQNKLPSMGGKEGEEGLVGEIAAARDPMFSGKEDEFTRFRVGPVVSPKPTNPLFYEYGDVIKDVLDRNNAGSIGLSRHYNLLNEQIKTLQAYSAGRKDQFREWQKKYSGAFDEYKTALEQVEAKKDTLTNKEYETELKSLNGLAERAKADRMVRDLGLDLSKRRDVLKLIDHLRSQQVELMKDHMKLVKIVEDTITKDMQQRGMLQPGGRFNIEDMKPW